MASQRTEFDHQPMDSSEEWKDELRRRIEAHRKQGETPASADGQGPELEETSTIIDDSEPPGRRLDPSSVEPSFESDVEEVPLSAAPADPGRPEAGSAAPSQSSGLTDDSLASLDWRSDPDSIERTLYPGSVAPSSRQQIITFSEKAEPAPPPIEETFRRPPAAAAFLDVDAQDLPVPEEAVPYDDGPPDADAVPQEDDVEWLSREIFLSRLLAGLVDLLLSGFSGLVFGWVASRLLGYDFFSTATIQIGAAVGLMFYWVSSTFFLSLSNQTPGMHLTGLRLLYQESSELPFMAVLIRTLIILPVIVTVAGLLWGVFDPWGRCLHDRVSQTRVAPIPEKSSRVAGADLFG